MTLSDPAVDLQLSPGVLSWLDGSSWNGTEPLRVGVHGVDQTAAIAARLNADPTFAFNAAVVTSAEIDTLAELEAFDVIIIGDYQTEAQYESFAPALRVGRSRRRGRGTQLPYLCGRNQYRRRLWPISTRSSRSTPAAAGNPLSVHPLSLATPTIPSPRISPSSSFLAARLSRTEGLILAQVLATVADIPALVTGYVGAGAGSISVDITTPVDSRDFQANCWRAPWRGRRASTTAARSTSRQRQGKRSRSRPTRKTALILKRRRAVTPIVAHRRRWDSHAGCFRRGQRAGWSQCAARLRYLERRRWTLLSGSPRRGWSRRVHAHAFACAVAAPLVVDSTSLADGATYETFPAEVLLGLNAEILLSSLAADDLLVNGQPATSLTIIDGSRVAVDISAFDGGAGSYTLTMAAGSLTSVGGQLA